MKKIVLSVMLSIMVLMCPITSMLSVQGFDYGSFYIRGDADGSSSVDVRDATAVQRHIAELDTLSGNNLLAADADYDGYVSISDATAIQMFLAEYGNPSSIAERINIDTPSDQPQLVVENVTANPGDSNVAVSVSVQNNPGIASLAFDVHYNMEALTLTNFTYNEEVIGGSSTVPYNINAQPTCLSMVNGSENINGDWVFATLYFDVKDSANGDYLISLSHDEDNIYSIDETNVAFAVVNGTISVGSTTETTKPRQEHKIIFKDGNGNVISEQTVQGSGTPNYPDPPAIEGYVFKTWDKTIDAVTGDTIINAVYEEVSNSPSFVIDSVEAHAGDTNVAVNVAVKNNPGVASILLEVVYDKDNLTLTNFTYNGEALEGCSTVPFNANAFAPCLNMVNGTQNVHGDWTFATLYFNVKDTATGSCPITVSFEDDNVFSIDEENVPFAIAGGAINVK